MIRLLLAACALLFAPVAASAQTDLAVRTAQVDDLTAVRQIKHLQARWGHMALAGNWAGMAAMGTEDVQMVLPEGPAVGRAALEASLRERQGHGVDGMPAGRMNLRLYISPVITLAADGQSATGRWHHIALTAEVGGEAGWIGTTDVIKYRLTPEGWKIANIRPYLHFSGPYAEGWSHDAATLERAPYHYTPDEAGVVLPQRAAATPRDAAALDTQAHALLVQSLAQNTVNAYGYYLDRGMLDDAADLFADDALIEQGGQGSWRGHEGVTRFLTRFGPAGLVEGELSDRLQLMPMANVAADGSMALVRNIELAMTGQHGGEGQWQVVMQTFLLRPDANGHWRIALMHHNPVMRSTVADGWSHPLPSALPIVPGGEPTGETQLGPVDFRDAGFAVPALAENLLMAPRGAAAAGVWPEGDPLALAEAFDGAENVSNAYGYYIDQFSWRNTAALFARDGWKELSYIGTFIGQDRVLGSLIQRYGEGGPRAEFQAIHQKTQPYVTVVGDGTRALVRTRLMQMNSSSTGQGSWIGGIYENQVIKENGIWRIHGMDLDYVWLADYGPGWTGADPDSSSRFAPTAELLAAFAPDAPLRGETFAPYPRIASMGFHFANPVSGREPETRLTWSDGHREP